MKTRVLLGFVAPSLVMMAVFIAAPLASVFIQSFVVSRPVFETIEVETCTPTLLSQTCTRQTKSRPVVGADGKVVTRSAFVGLESYQNVIEFGRAARAVAAGDWAGLSTIRFWNALRFTLTFTFVTLPFVLGLGLLLALVLDTAAKAVRGPILFVSLLPFIITPVIGALSIKWLFIGDGILTALIEWWLGRDVSFFGQSWTIEILMMVYRVWHVAPFAFLIFYAALQSLNRDTLDTGHRRRREPRRATALRDRPAPDAGHRLRVADPPDGQLPRVRGDRGLRARRTSSRCSGSPTTS